MEHTNRGILNLHIIDRRRRRPSSVANREGPVLKNPYARACVCVCVSRSIQHTQNPNGSGRSRMACVHRCLLLLLLNVNLYTATQCVMREREKMPQTSFYFPFGRATTAATAATLGRHTHARTPGPGIPLVCTHGKLIHCARAFKQTMRGVPFCCCCCCSSSLGHAFGFFIRLCNVPTFIMLAGPFPPNACVYSRTCMVLLCDYY